MPKQEIIITNNKMLMNLNKHKIKLIDDDIKRTRNISKEELDKQKGEISKLLKENEIIKKNINKYIFI